MLDSDVRPLARGRKLNPRINSASEAEQRKADELLAALECTGSFGLRRRCFVNDIPYNDVAPLERTTLIERLFEHEMGYPLFESADKESVA